MSSISSLETRLLDQVCFKSPFKTVFANFLFPNEYSPERIKPHLEPGLWVTTGTERSFFLLSMDGEDQCEGVVVRDVNPLVKAYNDFNILLLRLCDTREEYAELSTRPAYMDKDDGDARLLQDRIPIIRQKLQAANISPELKTYYLENLASLATIYFNERQDWRTIEKENFTHCRYDLLNELFLRVQKKAREGNFVSTVGCINDLTFLGERKVAVIDTSNISDYIFIDPKFAFPSTPRLIHTTNIPFTKFHSHKFVPLTLPERVRFEKIVEKYGRSTGKIHKLMRKGFIDSLNDHAWPVASPQALAILENSLRSHREVPEEASFKRPSGEVDGHYAYAGVEAEGAPVVGIVGITESDVQIAVAHRAVTEERGLERTVAKTDPGLQK